MFRLLKSLMTGSPKCLGRLHWQTGQVRRIVQFQMRMERLTKLRHCARQVVGALVVSAVVLVLAGNAAAQTAESRPGNGYVGVANPYNGYLHGAADVITAQGNYLVKTQHAYLMKEQVRAAQSDNRRRLVDEWLYRRANTPGLNDERERITREEARRSRNQPPLTEIWSGKALNDLLAVAAQCRTGPDVAIDSDLLKQINLTTGDGGNFGLLKNGGKLSWPLALRGLKDSGELREELQVAVSKAYGDARDGKEVDLATIQNIDEDLARLHRLLVKNVAAISFPQYSEAKTYLKQLDEAVAILKKGTAAKFINGDVTPRARTVAELVAFMSRTGLRFAPATANERAAYTALHQALVAYDVGISTLTTVTQR
jgi:hypothetical protein